MENKFQGSLSYQHDLILLLVVVVVVIYRSKREIVLFSARSVAAVEYAD